MMRQKMQLELVVMQVRGAAGAVRFYHAALDGLRPAGMIHSP
jgi:hypothetical protein